MPIAWSESGENLRIMGESHGCTSERTKVVENEFYVG